MYPKIIHTYIKWFFASRIHRVSSCFCSMVIYWSDGAYCWDIEKIEHRERVPNGVMMQFSIVTFVRDGNGKMQTHWSCQNSLCAHSISTHSWKSPEYCVVDSAQAPSLFPTLFCFSHSPYPSFSHSFTHSLYIINHMRLHSMYI